MAYDDIVKALTIQITADDLTGGMWSSVGKGVKTVWDNVTALNMAWELGAKVAGVFADAVKVPIEILSEGGEYAEARAGFESLANSYRVDGRAIVDTIRDISDGEAGLMEATQAASNAIKRGFSAEQSQAIFEFAKAYEDVMGGDFLQIAAEIEKGIATGNEKIAKTYDIPIKKGMEWAQIYELLKAKTEAMGQGAFNFGDVLAGAAQSAYDAWLKIEEQLDLMVGEDGIGSYFSTFRDYMRSIEKEAGTIARGIYVIAKDAVEAISKPIIAGYNFYSSVLGDFFSSSDDMGTKIKTIVMGIGSTIYEVAIRAAQVFNVSFTPMDAAIRLVAKSLSVIIDGMIKVNELTGVYGGEKVEILKRYGENLSKIFSEGYLKIDVDKIIAKQELFNKSILESKTVAVEAKKAHSEMSSGIKYAGEAYVETEKKTKSATKAVVESIESINKYGGVLFQANLLAQAGKIGTKEYEDLMKKASGATSTTTALTPSTTSTTTASGLLKTAAATTAKSGKLDVSLSGIDAKLKDFVEYIIDQVTTKAIAEGLITAGV